MCESARARTHTHTHTHTHTQPQDAKGEATVKGLSSWPVASEAEIYQLLQAASKKRETASTCHNQVWCLLAYTIAY